VCGLFHSTQSAGCLGAILPWEGISDGVVRARQAAKTRKCREDARKTATTRQHRAEVGRLLLRENGVRLGRKLRPQAGELRREKAIAAANNGQLKLAVRTKRLVPKTLTGQFGLGDSMSALNMLHLNQSSGSYPAGLLQAWTDGEYKMLTSSSASNYLKEILPEKASKRIGTRRFFGEAFVAANLRHEHGWYGSFKWLMTSKWLHECKVPERQRLYREALRRYFGREQLEEVQSRARSLHRKRGKTLKGKKPVPPDLWVVDAEGNHEFIEVKLPGDSMKPHQLAGLAIIASCLPASVSVRIISLCPGATGFLDVRETRELAENKEQTMFREFCAALGMP
jgi:hypothetical protein